MTIKCVNWDEWPGEFPNGDGAHNPFTGWDTGDWPNASGTPSPRLVREHERHVEHVPTCHFCREARRLGKTLEAKA